MGCAIAQPAEAFTVTYDFTVTVTSGDYIGSYQGQFSYDDANLTGNGEESVNATQDNLSILFTFLGNTYTESDDLDFPEFPQIYFQDGNLLGLNFIVLPPKATPGFYLFGTEFLVGNTDYFDGTLVGNITYKQWENPDPEPIPEPAEIAGSFLALVLMKWGLGRRHRIPARH
jgi:hypothetical protein